MPNTAWAHSWHSCMLFRYFVNIIKSVVTHCLVKFVSLVQCLIQHELVFFCCIQVCNISPVYISFISQLGYNPRYLEITPICLNVKIPTHIAAWYSDFRTFIFPTADQVLPFFRNWNFLSFLKWTKFMFNMSRPISLLIW